MADIDIQKYDNAIIEEPEGETYTLSIRHFSINPDVVKSADDLQISEDYTCLIDPLGRSVLDFTRGLWMRT